MNKILKREEKQLQHEFRKTYRNMKIYLAGKHLNKYAYEEALLELAGMCLEGAKRGVEPQDVFGFDYKRFCDEITENTKRQKLWEVILFQGCIISNSLFFFMLIVWLSSFVFPSVSVMDQTHISVNSLLRCLMIALLMSGSVFYSQTYAFQKTIKTLVIYMVSYMSIYMSVYALLVLSSEGEYLALPPVFVLLMMGLLALGLYSSYMYMQKKFWKQH